MKTPEPKTAYLVPGSPGLLCPFPGRGRRFLSEKGDRVRLDTWWRLRVKKGDAIVIPDEKAPDAAKTPAGTSSKTKTAKE